MGRPWIPREKVLLAALTIAVLPIIGCTNVLFTVAYLIHGTDVDPDFKDLKGKVAVICRAPTSLQYSNPNMGRELAQEITLLLQQQLPKIKFVDQRKIAKWTDEHDSEDFADVGKAVKADMVVGIDLESFDIYQGQTLYQGRASATVRVFDCKKKGKQVFHQNIPQVVYPPNSAVATSDRSGPGEFTHEFELKLADRIARCFYAHDPYADLGQDSDSLK